MKKSPPLGSEFVVSMPTPLLAGYMCQSVLRAQCIRCWITSTHSDEHSTLALLATYSPKHQLCLVKNWATAPKRCRGLQRDPLSAATLPKTLPSEGAVVATRLEVADQAAAPSLCNELGAVLWHGLWPRTNKVGREQLQAAGSSRFLVVRLCLLADDWWERALHARVGGTTRRRGSTTPCMASIGCRMPVLGQTRIAAAFRSPREARCQTLHRSSLAVWLRYTFTVGKTPISIRNPPSWRCSVTVQ